LNNNKKSYKIFINECIDHLPCNIPCELHLLTYMGSLSYKMCNNNMPTLNPKVENEKKKTTQKKHKINLGFQSNLASSKGV